MFRKDYTTVTGRSLSIKPFLEDLFIKVGTSIVYSEEGRAFDDLILEVGQQQYKEFVDTRLIICKKLVCDTITKNDSLTPVKSTAKAGPKKMPALKESDFNKLRGTALFCPCLCERFSK